jgi:hypothetical protein
MDPSELDAALLAAVTSYQPGYGMDVSETLKDMEWWLGLGASPEVAVYECDTLLGHIATLRAGEEGLAMARFVQLSHSSPQLSHSSLMLHPMFQCSTLIYST